MRCPVLVGRRADVEALDAALARAPADGSVVCFVGPPGIGKSRLAEEATRLAARRHATVLSGRATADSSAVPWRAVGEALLAGTRTAAPARTAELEPFLGVLGLLLPHWRPAGWQPPTESPIVVAEGVLRLLRHLAGERALLLVLEDMQWADPASIDVVQYLADHATETRTVMCLTLRGREGAGSALVAALGRAAADVRSLERLSSVEVDEMARACLGAAPDGLLAARLARDADGLPLLVEDLLAASSSGLPMRFADSVRSRLARLNHRHRRAVQVAALLGEQVDWDVVARAADAGPGALDAAIRLELLVAERSGVSFRHALTREVVLDTLVAPERAAASREAALALLAVGQSSVERDLLAAELLAAAGQSTESSQLLGAAAERAIGRGDLAAAEVALRRVVAAPDVNDASGLNAGTELVRVLLQSGRPAEAIKAGTEVLGRAEAHDDDVAQAARLLLARAELLRGHWPEATAHLDACRTRAAVATARAAEVALLDAECALGRGTPGSRVEVEHMASSAAALAAECGRADLECEAYEVAGRAARLRDLDAAASAFERALSLAEANDLRFLRLRGLNELGTVEVLRDARGERLQRARAEATRAGALGMAASTGLNLASLHVMLGEYEETESIAREVGATAARLGLSGIEAGCYFMLGAAAAHQGRPDESEACLAAAERLAPGDSDLRSGAWAICRGLGALVLEDRDAARRGFRRAREEGPDLHARILDAAAGPLLLLDAVAGTAALRDVEAATRGSVVGARYPALWNGAARAVVLGRAGASADANDALAAAEAAGAPYTLFVALARRLVAEAALEDGWTDPVALLRDAETAFTRLGLARSLASTRGLLQAAGAPAPRRRAADADLPETLRRAGVTVREADVLDLLADRLTNRDVAARLYLSPRTIEKHVAALAQKLGASDRAALADLARSLRHERPRN